MALDDERDYESSGGRAEILDAETVPICCSDTDRPDWSEKYVLAKLPIVIAEPKIQVNVEAVIRLEDKAFEIKRIYKNLLLTQCELIPLDCGKRGKLFIGGFIRKNIEYATAKHVGDDVISGDIRHTTVKTPFTCVAIVEFIAKPEFQENFLPVEVEVLNKHCKGKDPNEKRFSQHVTFNEGVYCELVEANFHEIDIKKDPKTVSLNETVFDTLIEKIVVDIKVKILQNQQVKVPRSRKQAKHDRYEKCDDHWDKGWDDDYDDKDHDGGCCGSSQKSSKKKKGTKNNKCGIWEY